MKTTTLPTLLLLCICLVLACGEAPTQDTNNSAAPETTEVDAPAPTPAPSGPVRGIDVSEIQGDEVMDLSKYKDDLTFVICKATEGRTFTDPTFKQNWEMIKQEGFIRGAYHFYRTQDSPRSQATLYLRAISTLEATDIPPIVDFEEKSIDGDRPIEEVQQDLLEFLATIEELLERKPLIYTDPNIGNKYLDAPQFSNYPLWIADYDNPDAPTLPGAWKNLKWSFWQKTSKYQLDGRNNDLDVYNGDLAALKLFIQQY